MNKRPTSPVLRALDSVLEGRTASWIINLAVIPFLILLAFILPPVALPQRILSAGYSGISAKTGGGVSVADGANFAIPAGVAKTDLSIRLNSQTREAFLKSALSASLPATLDVKSPLYQPSLQGQMPAQAILSLPIPDGADPFATLDVYGYYAKKWVKLPFQMYLDEQRLEAYLTTFIPEGVVIAQTGLQSPTISADLQAALPASASPLLAEVNPLGLMIVEGGGVSGAVPSVPEASASSPYQVLPTITNLDGDQVRGDIVDEMLTTPEIRAQHIQTLVDLAVEKLYPGLDIEYQQVSAENRKEFTAFVRDLAQALHAKDKILSVTLPMPEPRSLDIWETGAYDWTALGQIADIVRIPLPTTRDAYTGDAPLVHTYLLWAVGRIDRYKLQLTFSVEGRDEFGDVYAPVTLANAFKLIGPVNVPATILPSSQVTFDLPKLRETGGVKHHAATGLYSFSYKDDKNQTHSIWIENAESIAKKLGLALEYNLRGVALRDLSDAAMEARAWGALTEYRELQLPATKGKLVLVWRVNGNTVGKSAATEPRYTWTAPAGGGEVQVEAVLSFDEGQSAIGTTGVAVAQIVRPTPTPAPRPTAAPSPVTTRAPAAPSSAFRGQNLFNYGAQLNWTSMDNNVEMGQLSQMGFKWAKVQIRWCDFEGNRGNIDYGQMDRLIGAANAKGIKVMFSVVCAPGWSRPRYGDPGSGPPDDMQDAANFMGNLAAKYCGSALGAIEVWNEHNLRTEWHDKRGLSAALYMDMLKKSYAAIKQRCPSIVVVSGAPTPTGVTNADAIDDVAFLHQLYQNGLKDACDAVGAHPSGFLNPPEVAPGTPNKIGQFQGHRSFYFRGTMEAYRAVMVQYGDGNKQVWPTEFGWGVDPNPKPGYEYERFISLEEQARWLVQAYQMMKNWGWVGVAILWNLDFMDMSHEVGAFHVVGRPAFDALAGMAK